MSAALCTDCRKPVAHPIHDDKGNPFGPKCAARRGLRKPRLIQRQPKTLQKRAKGCRRRVVRSVWMQIDMFTNEAGA